LGTNQALEAARALALNPSLAPLMRQACLPSDVSVLLRFLASEIPASELTRGDGSRLQHVVERYVLDVMLFPGAAPERILGVPAGASRDEMRAHMRLLMIWLHPDRPGDSWRAPYSRRVLEAWRRTSTPAPAITDGRPPLRKGRPQTRPVKLSWVARPVPQQRQFNRRSKLIAPALVIAALAFFIIVDNPMRHWVQATMAEHAARFLD
jgi:hypothetical protein